MHKLPKKPKARKMPKKPKQSAGLTTWEGYDKRKRDTEAANKAALAHWHARCSKIKSDEHKRQALIKKHSR